MIILLLIFAALVALGIVFLCGKGTFLISGCNSFSKSEKENIDEKNFAGSWRSLCLRFRRAGSS